MICITSDLDAIVDVDSIFELECRIYTPLVDLCTEVDYGYHLNKL